MPRAVLLGLERKVLHTLEGLKGDQRDIVERECWIAICDVAVRQGTPCWSWLVWLILTAVR